MSDFTMQITDRRLPAGQSIRLRIKQFQQKLSTPAYHSKVHDVLYVTDQFYSFLKSGLPLNRMLILRGKLSKKSITEPKLH